MSDDIDVLWINSSHVLQRFDRPLLRYISQYVNVAQWEYHHYKDEGSSIDEAVDLVDEFLGQVSMPMMICASKNNPIVNSPALTGWLKGFKPEAHLWECLQGYHFFHYFYPQKVCEEMLSFWQPYHLQAMLTSPSFYRNLAN
ncbi:MAG: hypothetical protein ACYT04_42870 [Nostoc sp.]